MPIQELAGRAENPRHTSAVHKSLQTGRRGVEIMYGGAKNLWKLASCHPFRAQSFQVASRF